MNEYKRINRTLVKKGAIIDYYQDTIQLPDGSEKTYDFIDHKGAAAVVPVLPDGRIIMVRQERNAIDDESLGSITLYFMLKFSATSFMCDTDS